MPPVSPNGAATEDNEFAFAGLPTGESAPTAVAPYMIGDFFAGQGQIVFRPFESPMQRSEFAAQIPAAGGTGRVKISDDNSVLPTDRVFFLYNYFDNAILVSSPTTHLLDVNRYTPGFEKTFWDGNGSLELRLPFASTQDSDIAIFGDGKNQDEEFGNLQATLKFLVWRNADWAVAAGLGFNTPTASDVRVFDDFSAQPALIIKNDALHVQPYVGFLYTPNDRLFVQMFVEFDVAANGNRVDLRDVGDIGTLYDQNLFQTDLQIGYWWYRDASASADHGHRADRRVSLHDDDPRREIHFRLWAVRPIHAGQPG